MQKVLDKRPALKALGLEVCACGQPKRRKQYFCLTCWRGLRGVIRIALKLPYDLSNTEHLYQLALAELEEAGRIPEPAGSTLSSGARVILECIASLNALGCPAMAFDVDSVVADLLGQGLVERRDGGLWVTDKGREVLKEVAS